MFKIPDILIFRNTGAYIQVNFSQLAIRLRNAAGDKKNDETFTQVFHLGKVSIKVRRTQSGNIGIILLTFNY